MNIKRFFYTSLILIFFSGTSFAQAAQNSSAQVPASKNNFILAEKAKSLGMTFYWDSLSETGMLEKNGHQLTFRNNESIVVLDSMLMKFTDAPSIEQNKVKISQKFLSDAEILFSQNNSTMFKVGAVILDAGHGGKDPGALKTYKINGKNVTIQEKDITLKVAKMLYERMKTSYPDKQIILTRNTDKFLSLSERTDIANKVKVKENEAILFISVHVNSSLNKTSSGYEVWYLSPGYRRTVLDKNAVEENDSNLFEIVNSILEEEYTTESIMIAQYIMDGLQAQIGSESKARGIKAEEWFVVKNANMPSVLIELGFVSNEAEALKLNDEKYLKKATLGIYNGISAFITHFERSKGFTSVK
ncbi:MAG: N-acetylmuramoyl-L-alanine amidase [Treponema sp.]|nr:N-acetylmuramoyl-L-alanine amidase [Treponema sp.]